MRSIIFKKKSNRTKQFILGGGLIFVMFFSVVGYSFIGREGGSNTPNKIIYNEIEFVNQNGLWFTRIGQTQFAFKHNPKQVERIESSVNSLDSYLNKPLYISSESVDAKYEIGRNLEQIVLRMREAYIEGDVGEENLPTKTCEDNFIIIKENLTPGIIQYENCVFIEGPQENLTQITDEFLFKVLGIEQ